LGTIENYLQSIEISLLILKACCIWWLVKRKFTEEIGGVTYRMFWLHEVTKKFLTFLFQNKIFRLKKHKIKQISKKYKDNLVYDLHLIAHYLPVSALTCESNIKSIGKNRQKQRTLKFYIWMVMLTLLSHRKKITTKHF